MFGTILGIFFKIILSDHPISLCLYLYHAFSFWSLNADLGNGPNVETIFTLAIIILDNRVLEPRTVGTVGTWQCWGDTFQIYWSEDATCVNIPDKGDHDNLVMEMLQNIQNGMLTCLHKIPKPEAEISTCSQASLHCQHLNMEAAEFGLSDCRLPFACFHRKNAITRERGPSRDEKYHDGRLPLHLPALHHLFDLRTSDTVSPKKNIMQLVVMVTRASGFRGWKLGKYIVHQRWKVLFPATGPNRTAPHLPSIYWGILPDLQENGHWWMVMNGVGNLHHSNQHLIWLIRSIPRVPKVKAGNRLLQVRTRFLLKIILFRCYVFFCKTVNTCVSFYVDPYMLCTSTFSQNQ